MKIAIMTQPLGNNYGGIMQAWALQQVLKRMGHQPVTIDRQPNQPNMVYKAARLIYRAGMKTIGKRKVPINFEKHLPTILQHTQGFIDQHLTISEPLCSTQQLRDHFERENYDAVIVGSDQTWRPKYSPDIYNYFLDFLEDKKILRIAYASSFGVDDWEFTAEQTKRCAELAKKFDAISVREDSGVELCKKHLNVSATLTLDPTLLLNNEDYLSIVDKIKLGSHSKTVCAYFLDKTPETQFFAEALAAQIREDVHYLQPKHWASEDTSDSIDSYILPDISEWIHGFNIAKVILTDSFHGVAFSHIFQKPFFAVINKSRGSTRITSLLSMSGNTNRIIKLPNENLPQKFSPLTINNRLYDEKLNSMSFLGKYLSTPQCETA